MKNEIKIVDASGNQQGTVDLGLKPSPTSVDPKTYACAVRVLLQNWRQGTLGCKTRGEVAFSNKKPWRQKGTGRARAGSLRSPLWRKGGVIFGPQPRVRELSINKKQVRGCLKKILEQMVEKGAIYCIDFDFNSGKAAKTKDAYNLLKKAKVENRNGILFLPHDDVLNFTAFRNIPDVNILSFDQANVFDLSGVNYWMFLKKDVELFKKMVAQWI